MSYDIRLGSLVAAGAALLLWASTDYLWLRLRERALREWPAAARDEVDAPESASPRQLTAGDWQRVISWAVGIVIVVILLRLADFTVLFALSAAATAGLYFTYATWATSRQWGDQLVRKHGPASYPFSLRAAVLACLAANQLSFFLAPALLAVGVTF